MISSVGSISVPLAFGFDNPYLIQQSLQALVGPMGVVLAIGMAFMLFASVAYRRFFWIVVTLLLVTSTITSHVSGSLSDLRLPYHPLLESIAQQGRNIVLALLLVLMLPSLLINKGTRGRLINPALLAYLLFEILYTFEIAAARSQGSLLRLVIGIMLFTLTFVVFGFGLSKMLQSGLDALDAVRSIAWMGVIVAAITAFELFTNPKSVILGGRLASVAATATFCAEMFVAAMLPTLYLIIRPGARGWARVFWMCAFAVETLMMIGSGTRTGILMSFVGIVIMLRSRLAKLFPVAIGATILIAIALLILPENLGIIGAERMLDTTDSRTAVWHEGWQQFLSSPFFGVSVDGENVIIENSYIDAFATAGLIGGAPFLLALILFGRSMFQMQRRRSTLDSGNQLFIDLLIGAFVAELVGAFFDAYLLATVSVQLYVVVMYGTLMYFVLDRTSQAQEQQQYVAPPPTPLAYDPAYAI